MVVVLHISQESVNKGMLLLSAGCSSYTCQCPYYAIVGSIVKQKPKTGAPFGLGNGEYNQLHLSTRRGWRETTARLVGKEQMGGIIQHGASLVCTGIKHQMEIHPGKKQNAT